MAPEQVADGLLEVLVDAVQRVSQGFDRWDDQYVRGPGLYVLVVDGTPDAYSDPMGHNRWPVEECQNVTDDPDQFVETARSVGTTNDGAIVVNTDGRIEQQMVRLYDLRSTDETRAEAGAVEYADWMGTRHMSAAEASARSNVVATVTLSEEDGRVSMFVDGEHRPVA